ncbi:MAG: transglycosylase family protein [Acidimicrobiales bacterium]
MARAQRSRLALAAAITLAALPVLLIDNLPATAETSDDRVEVLTSADEVSSSSQRRNVVTAAMRPTTTTTTVAPTTTAAPETTTSTTEAPPTTQAPAVQALRAPAPVSPTTTAAPPPPPAASAPPALPSAGPGDPNDPAAWDRLAQCESYGNWGLNTGNGYYGGLQFSLASWQNVGGAGYPHQASRDEQIHRGKILQARAGWGQWPHCSRQLGYT